MVLQKATHPIVFRKNSDERTNRASVKTRERGNALVEFALVAPLAFVLFIILMDAGVYLTAFISLQNASRAASIRNSAGTEAARDQAKACEIVRSEIDGMLGVPETLDCHTSPLVVTSQYCEGAATCAGHDVGDSEPTALVSVSYTIPSVFQLPFGFPSTINLQSHTRVRSYE